MEEKIYENLNRIFQDVFDDKKIRVCETITAEDIEGWDSLEHIGLIVAIEKKFGMKFSMNEVAEMKSVGEMADIILKKVRVERLEKGMEKNLEKDGSGDD